ncbi:MAG: hypothetical protein V8Q54_04540 [Alistipes senegalensis]
MRAWFCNWAYSTPLTHSGQRSTTLTPLSKPTRIDRSPGCPRRVVM